MVRAVLASQTESDLLDLLPRRSLHVYARGTVIYSPHQPCNNLYLVMTGRVKVSTSPDGGETVCRLGLKGNLFGELSLIPGTNHLDTAVVLNASTLLVWTAAEIEKQVEVNPR